MAGHSKWANIKHRKGAQDAKKGKIFTKIIREITIAARLSGGDVSTNPRLRLAMDKANLNNMAKDTVLRAIKKGVGDEGGAQLEEIRYEGYGINGVAVIVDCTSDNRNRTVSEVRHAFTKNGGNLGTDGSVAYLFNKQGQLIFNGADEVQIMDIALENEAVDVLSFEDGTIDVRTTPELFEQTVAAFKAKQLIPDHAEVSFIPTTEVEITDLDTAQTLLRMIETLEDLDDVQEVYNNAHIPDEIVEQLNA